MRFLPFMLLLAPLAAPAAQFYIYDDGTAEFSTIASSNHVLANAFKAEAGKLDISGMMFYNFQITNGHAITYALWGDPTNDGNLTDAKVLQTVNSTLTTAGWQNVVFPSLTSFNEGDWFYVGAYFTDPVFSYFVGGVDTNSGNFPGNSWWVRWTTGTVVDLNALNTGTMASITDSGLNLANLLVRATVAEPVPEPSAFWLSAAGLGIAGLWLRRRP